MGISYGVVANKNISALYLSGLKDNLDAGLELLESFWSNAKADPEVYAKYIQSIEKNRKNSKTNKGSILRSGLVNYAKYGENSHFRDNYSLEELKAKDPQVLVDLVKSLKNYEHSVFYYGKDKDQAKSLIEKHHKLNAKLKPIPAKRVYKALDTGNQVYFVNYDMVQAEMMFIANSGQFDKKNFAASRLFNSYFGSGLSSIVFQEIRESKSLAYSAYSYFSNGSELGDHNYVNAYVGTQANKSTDAVNAMFELLKNMPHAQEQFENSKESALKAIASERIVKSSIYWNFRSLKKQGLDYDIRKEIYTEIENMTFEDLQKFYDENIKNGEYTIIAIGNKKDVDFNALSKFGEVKELEIDHLFNY